MEGWKTEISKKPSLIYYVIIIKALSGVEDTQRALKAACHYLRVARRIVVDVPNAEAAIVDLQARVHGLVGGTLGSDLAHVGFPDLLIVDSFQSNYIPYPFLLVLIPFVDCHS